MRSLLATMGVVLAIVLAAPPSAAAGFADNGSATAKRAGGTVTITVAGKGEWRVNTDFPIKVELGAAKLGKADAKYAGVRDGKADSVTFTTKDAAAKGLVTAVFCNKTSCTSPLKTEFVVSN